MPTVVEFLKIVDFCTMILIKPIFIIPDYCTVQDYLYLDLSQRRESLVQRVVPARLFSGLAEIADFC